MGSTYSQLWGPGAGSVISAGSSIKVKVELNSANTQIEHLTVLYK